MANIFKNSSNPFVSDISLTASQDKHLVRQVIVELSKFYKKVHTQKLVLNAFTGSGKTTVAIKALIPEFIRSFYPLGKRVIGFMAPNKEVVEGSFFKAVNALHNTTVDGKKICVYSQLDIDSIKEKTAGGHSSPSLDGDIIIFFITAQYFNKNFNYFDKHVDLMIVDEAHIMFGTINEEDTKADKGTRIRGFKAVTLTKLSLMTTTAVLFLTATPTVSQKTGTNFGRLHNKYLKPMPRDVLTTPFYDIIPYVDHEEVLYKGLDHFKLQCKLIGELISQIEDSTWEKAKDNFYPVYPVLLARLAKEDAKNGLDLEQYLQEIRNICKSYGFKFFVSRSKGKEYDGAPIKNMNTGIQRSRKENDSPIVMLVLDSGYAGVDIEKLNTVIIARTPSTTCHNNYSQTAGRAARMKFDFRNHATAAEKIREYDISDEQKRLLAEYYIEHSSSTVHVPLDSKLLNRDVKDFIETDTWRKDAGAAFILQNVFLNKPVPKLYLSTSVTIQDDTYKQYKKKFCESCLFQEEEEGHSQCFYTAWRGFQHIMKCKISESEMELIWPKCLQVHHLDGNHFNNDPTNLSTLCPNVHSLITIHHEDYKNRYADLHASLNTIAKKKGSKFHLT